MLTGRPRRKVELNASIDSCHEKLVSRKLRYESAAMVVLGSCWLPSSVVLRKSERDGRPPVAEVEFGWELAFLSCGGLHSAFKIQTRDLAVHGTDQGKILGVERRSLIRFVGPARAIHSEG